MKVSLEKGLIVNYGTTIPTGAEDCSKPHFPPSTDSVAGPVVPSDTSVSQRPKIAEFSGLGRGHANRR